MPPSSPRDATARLSFGALETARSRAGVHALLGLLGVRWGRAHLCAEVVAVKIAIRDLQGRRVLEIPAAQPPLDLELPAGTYHVSVDVGAQRRLYTIVLEPGARDTLALQALARDLIA